LTDELDNLMWTDSVARGQGHACGDYRRTAGMLDSWLLEQR
jgi:hypothetical protein